VPRLLRKEIEEIPLRHQGDEPAPNREVAHVGDGDLFVCHPARQLADFIMRALQEFVEQPEFAEQLEGRGMDRVAAEIAEEIRVLLQNLHLAARASEQQPGHHPGWAATGHNEIELSHGLRSLKSRDVPPFYPILFRFALRARAFLLPC